MRPPISHIPAAAPGGPPLRLDDGDDGRASRGKTPDVAGRTRQSPGRGHVRCAACGHRLTTVETAVSRDGGHEHVFCNPAGLVFRLVLFRHAPGCLTVDPPSFEFTWFPGYQWRIAGCGRCAAHLGWRFDHAAGDAFYGLIAERIVVDRDA